MIWQTPTLLALANYNKMASSLRIKEIMSCNAKFKWFPQQYVIFFLAIIFINGCAGSVISVQGLMDTHTEVNSAPIIDASLGVVTLGYVPKDEMKGEMWRQALKLSLNK